MTGQTMTDRSKIRHLRKRGEECRITDVDRDNEAVYVHFGEFGQATCYPVKNCETTKSIIHTDSLEASDTIRVVDIKPRWTLRKLDDYFHSRIGTSIDELRQESEQLASSIGKWFIAHYDCSEYESFRGRKEIRGD